MCLSGFHEILRIEVTPSWVLRAASVRNQEIALFERIEQRPHCRREPEEAIQIDGRPGLTAVRPGYLQRGPRGVVGVVTVWNAERQTVTPSSESS